MKNKKLEIESLVRKWIRISKSVSLAEVMRFRLQYDCGERYGGGDSNL